MNRLRGGLLTKDADKAEREINMGDGKWGKITFFFILDLDRDAADVRQTY